jgi:hypothetical protein
MAYYSVFLYKRIPRKLLSGSVWLIPDNLIATRTVSLRYRTSYDTIQFHYAGCNRHELSLFVTMQYFFFIVETNIHKEEIL